MEIGIRVLSPTAPKLWGENSSNIGVVAPTGFEPVFYSQAWLALCRGIGLTQSIPWQIVPLDSA
jgi:hypothetical protein